MTVCGNQMAMWSRKSLPSLGLWLALAMAGVAAFVGPPQAGGAAGDGPGPAPQGETAVAGTVQHVDLRGTSLRFLTGKISTNLVVSGAITRGGATVFAFQDRLHLVSPISPGPPAPKAAELLR